MSASKHILVIDDNTCHYELLCEQLAHNPTCIRLTRASDMETGTKLLKSHRYDLIVTELQPSHHGEDWISVLKAMARGLPVVVLTTSDDQKMAVNAMKMGADDYLVKNRETLAHIVKHMIKAMQGKRQIQRSGERRYSGAIDMIARNLKTITGLINQPGKGWAKGKDKLRNLEREIDNLKGMLRNLIS